MNLPVFHNGSLIAVIGISGNPDEVRKYAYLAEKITHLLIREQELKETALTLTEKRSWLIQTLIDGTIDKPEYILNMLRDFHINHDASLRVILIQIHTQNHPTNFSSAESMIEKLFRNADIPLFCRNYPNEILALTEDGVLNGLCPTSQ